jgi:hypothetical protein
MPLPDAASWYSNQQSFTDALSGSGAPSVPIPDWAAPYISPEQWSQMVAEAQAASQSSTPTGTGLSPGSYRAWGSWTPEQRFTSLLNASAARALPQGADSPFQNDSIARAGFLGAGIGSIFANLGAAGAGAAGASGSPAYTGATTAAGLPTGAASAAGGGVGTMSGVVPSVGASPGLVAGIGAAGAAGAGGGATNALTGAAGNIPDWVGNYLLPGLNTLLGANAANQASDAMVGAADRAIEENRRQYDTSRNDLAPWLDSGRWALSRLNDPKTNFLASPDYEFRRSEGERGIGNSFAARGGAASGNALRALSEYNSNLASGEFGDWWNRQAGLAGVGQTTGTQLGALGADSAASVGNYLTNQGAARASGVLGRNAAVAGGLNDGFYNYMYRRRA